MENVVNVQPASSQANSNTTPFTRLNGGSDGAPPARLTQDNASQDNVTKVMLFGGCNLRGPFMRMKFTDRRPAKTAEAWAKVPTGVTFSGVPYMTYTAGEMLQAIQIYEGRRYVPREVRLLAGIPEDFVPHPRSGLKNIDALMIEPNTSLEIMFEGYCLNRNRVMNFLVPIRALGGEMDKLAGRWYQKGISSANDKVRTELAEAIIDGLPDDYPELHFTTSFLRSARGVKRSMQPALEELLAAVDKPVGLVGYIWRYMPDGRAISWPADFGKDVRQSAAKLGLPMLDVGSIVGAQGIATAMRGDLRHYSEEFQPVVASHLVEFVKRVIAGHREKAPTADPLLPVTAAVA